MNVLEKLEQNIDQVNADLQGIKTKIIECGVTVPDGTKTADYIIKVGEVYEAGKNNERNAFWNIFQSTDTAMSYYDTFAYGRFTDENYFPRFPIRCTNGASAGARIFYNATNISDTKVPIYARKTLDSAFFNCVKLRRVPLLSVEEQTTFANTFSWCADLEEITFDGTIGQNISFEHCKKLTRASLDSIRDHLSDSVTGKTCTFSEVAVYWAGFSLSNEENHTPGVDSGPMNYDYWYEWCAVKPNWTITLV